MVNLIPNPDKRYNATHVALVQYEDAELAIEFVTDEGKRVGVSVDRITFFSFLSQAKVAAEVLRRSTPPHRGQSKGSGGG